MHVVYWGCKKGIFTNMGMILGSMYPFLKILKMSACSIFGTYLWKSSISFLLNKAFQIGTQLTRYCAHAAKRYFRVTNVRHIHHKNEIEAIMTIALVPSKIGLAPIHWGKIRPSYPFCLLNFFFGSTLPNYNRLQPLLRKLRSCGCSKRLSSWQ